MPRAKVLGPVAVLEDHVPPDWWKHLFNSLYLKTDGDVVDDPQITRNEIDLFSRLLRLQPEDRILDLCCGHGRHSLELSRRGFNHVQGVDSSQYLIRRAKDCARNECLQAGFRKGDVRKLPFPPASFDVACILGNSFGYFETLEDELALLKVVRTVLKSGGRLLLDIADGDYLKKHFQPRSWEWAGDKHFVCRERALSRDGERLISREVATHVDKGVVADQFYAERLYTRTGISDLLRTAGFANISFHEGVTPDSKRNQDLGMMERRIVVTSMADAVS